MSVSRFREEGVQVPSTLPYNVVFYGPNPGAPISGVEAVGSYAGVYRYISDVKTKGFRKQANFRKWVSNPYSSGRIQSTSSQVSHTSSNVADAWGRGITRTWTMDGVGYIFGPLVNSQKTLSFGSYPDIVNVDNLRKLAIIGCLNRINPALSQSLVTAAEAHKSVDMIRNRAKKLAALYVAFRKGDIKSIEDLVGKKPTKRFPKRIVVWDDRGRPIMKKSGKPVALYGHKNFTKKEWSRLDVAAQLELEYRYGWTPLVLDIVDSLKALYETTRRAEATKRDFTRVYESKTAELSRSTNLTSSKGGGVFTGTLVMTHKVEIKAYAKYTLSNMNGFANRLNDFGIFDIPVLAWELATLSFVIDWFVPIGDWLSAATPKVGVEVIESGVVIASGKTVVRTITGYTPDCTTSGCWIEPPFPIGATDSFVATGKSRSLGLPVPLLPPTEVKLNFSRLVDAVALLRVMR